MEVASGEVYENTVLAYVPIKSHYLNYLFFNVENILVLNKSDDEEEPDQELLNAWYIF